MSEISKSKTMRNRARLLIELNKLDFSTSPIFYQLLEMTGFFWYMSHVIRVIFRKYVLLTDNLKRLHLLLVRTV